MSQVIYGDLSVKRAVSAARRVNQGLSSEALIAARPVTAYDFAWLKISNAATQNVVLPDATSLVNGWDLVVMADAASAASVNVMTFDAVTPILLQNVLANRAFKFTLLDGSTPAGVWHVEYLDSAIPPPAVRYVAPFNATTAWGSASAGYYTFAVTAATHLMGVNPVVMTFSGAGPFQQVQADQCLSAANGDVSVKVPDDPDCRFAGQLIIM
jgi:hypothetical protein